MAAIQKIKNSPVFDTQAIIEEDKIFNKVAKHLEETAPISSGFISPFAAFQNGCEEAIASYIKLGSEGHVTQKIVAGPLQKTPQTTQMEAILKKILKNFYAVKFIKEKDQYFVFFEGKKYNFVDILIHTNFNLISLSKEDLQAYERMLHNGKLHSRPDWSGRMPTDLDFQLADPKNLCAGLSYAEKAAINIFTGNEYRPMNSLLRQDIDQFLLSHNIPYIYKEEERLNLAFKETLLHAAVVVSGLNKLPDYSGSGKYLYRGESNLPEKVLANRLSAINDGGKITWETGFLSTSHTQPLSVFYCDSAVLFKNLKGKNISVLSQFPSEREICSPQPKFSGATTKRLLIWPIFSRRKCISSSPGPSQPPLKH